MSSRINISSGAPWEDQVGYSRAVQLANYLEISGTVAVDEQGHTVGAGSYYDQAHYILSRISAILEQAGFSLNDVVRTRMYVRDIRQWEEVGRAHGEFFGVIKPATSMVEVSGLIGPDYLVEIEATAIRQV